MDDAALAIVDIETSVCAWSMRLCPILNERSIGCQIMLAVFELGRIDASHRYSPAVRGGPSDFPFRRVRVMPEADQFEDAFVEPKLVGFQVWVQPEFSTEAKDFGKFGRRGGFGVRRRSVGDVVPKPLA